MASAIKEVHTTALLQWQAIADLPQDLKQRVSSQLKSLVMGPRAIETFGQILSGTPCIRSAFEMGDTTLLQRLREQETPGHETESHLSRALEFAGKQDIGRIQIQIPEAWASITTPTSIVDIYPRPYLVGMYLLNVVDPVFCDLFVRCFEQCRCSPLKPYWQSSDTMLDWAKEELFGGRMHCEAINTEASVSI
ncbi:hypothetical protein LTR78_007452 [Recurvomyces mirabilis]|uniref:Uncharacterized protein n=1 Tax=Recurvomyces mirabilis TaxID=574656 RepID=A0AAE0TRU5_9PEZI|nr:hypothetical protein LTR78_007452 [Recurvomyces mirabilis]